MALAVLAANPRMPSGSEDADTQYDDSFSDATTQLQDIAGMFPAGYQPITTRSGQYDPTQLMEVNGYRAAPSSAFVGSGTDWADRGGPLLAGLALMTAGAGAGLGALGGESLPGWVSGEALPLGGNWATAGGAGLGAGTGAGWVSGEALPLGANWATTGPALGTSFAANPFSNLGTNALKELERLMNNPLRTAGGLASVLSSLYGSSQARGMTSDAVNRMDPFGPFRSQYATQLSALMNNPGSITEMPGYKAGEQAVMRSMGAQGYQGSGNMAGALMDYGNKFYGTEVDRLAGLAGAGINPAGVGATSVNGYAAAQKALTDALTRLGMLFPS